MDFDSWIASLREVLQEQDNPLTLRNGHWEVVDRKALWSALGSRVFDTHLDQFKDCSVEVLTELDPQFELPPEERYAASIHGKILKHSSDLRQGIAETLALLGSHGGILQNCSQHKPESIAFLAIREIFEQADWKLWGSLDSLLPTLAEAAPGEFLNSVEKALQKTPCPFDELFAQEGKGIIGRNYMTGLLWALEGLSWFEEHFVRVTVILAELASHDPGGNWLNRPSNSLTTIFLPWYPQTLVPLDKRFAAIKTVRTEFPDVAWEVLLSLLPNQYQTTSGAHKPSWSTIITEDWEPKVTDEEFWEQVTGYAELAVEMACGDLDKLKELVGNLDNLPLPSFNTVLEYLSSEALAELPENQRLPIWTNLTDFARKHRRFSDAKWALDDENVSKIEAVANRLAPSSPEGWSRRLFSNNDFDLYDQNEDWEEQHKILDERRQQAIQEIFDASGLSGIISFIDTVESPDKIGWALGLVDDKGIDSNLLPSYLDAQDIACQQFAGSFVWSRYQRQGWQWVDELDRTNWSMAQNCLLLRYLPFDEHTWRRASEWLGESEIAYWQKVRVNPYQSDNELLLPIDKLLEVSRPKAAIDCLNRQLYKKLPLDTKRTIRALLDAVSTLESSTEMDSYHITNLIKALQDDPQTDQDGLFKVEWAYLNLLDRHNDAEPKLLEKALCTQPDFFCEVIRLIFRSEKEEKKDKKPDEKRKAMASHAWKLLHEWRRPPGLHEDGKFSAEDFNVWLQNVKRQCEESGHLDVAMEKVGEVLFYCPPDPDELWIVRAAAEALNERGADGMRRGFHIKVFNSRGADWVDPTGKPERDLSEKWRKRAEEVEIAGFTRFATALRELAASYDHQAERIIGEHELEEG